MAEYADATMPKGKVTEPLTFRRAQSVLAAIGRRFYGRGWAVGTSGNFSAVVSRRPLRLAMTSSATSKRSMAPADILRCDEHGRAVGSGRGKPSAEDRKSVV